MHAIAHEARMQMRVDPKNPESMTNAQSLAGLAAKGIDSARVALEEPRYPACVEYLRAWSQRLFGRSGATMDGVAPLSDVAIAAWRLNTGHQPTPDEVDALMLLDAVRRDPSIVKDETPKVDAETRKQSAAARWAAGVSAQ